jgi:hypothetical protein
MDTASPLHDSVILYRPPSFGTKAFGGGADGGLTGGGAGGGLGGVGVAGGAVGGVGGVGLGVDGGLGTVGAEVQAPKLKPSAHTNPSPHRVLRFVTSILEFQTFVAFGALQEF